MLNVVLDIDDTLVKHIKRAVVPLVSNLSDFETEPSRSGLFALRPHLDEFMAYLFENHNVSIWTWSDDGYAHLVASILKRRYEKAHPGKTAKFKDILSAEDADLSSEIHGHHGKDLNWLWYDFNKEFIETFSKITPKNAKEEDHKKRALAAIEQLEERNASIAKTNKKLIEKEQEPYFAGEKEFVSGYAPCNTILVDDADYNYVVPGTRENMIKIKPFGGKTETKGDKVVPPNLDKDDTSLLTAIKILKSIKPDCEGDKKHELLFIDGGPKAGRRSGKRHTLKRRRLHKRKRFTRRA